MRRPSLAALALMLPATGAWAHAFLDRSSPPVGATVGSAPRAVTLTFTEAIEPLFSRVQVTDAKGNPVTSGKPAVQGDGRVLAVGLTALPPGTYTVDWHVTSVDTHRTQGHFTFTVQP